MYAISCTARENKNTLDDKLCSEVPTRLGLTNPELMACSVPSRPPVKRSRRDEVDKCRECRQGDVDESSDEDTSSLPVPETKFEGSEGERLGQLVVTPEVVANKINNMKENKSPGVDGIAPKILKETVEQICTPLAHVFNMSLQEGIVPLEWKEANIIPLFKKGSRNKSVNYRPVSLTSVICKVLETIIRDHMMDFLIKHKLTRRSTEAGSYQFCGYK